MVDGLIRVLFLSLALGVLCFVIGTLPLSLPFSAKHRLQLSTFGNGLLLGAALGIIIPEGVEAAYSSNASNKNPYLSATSEIALSTMIGFTFMLIVEQFLSRHVPHPTHTPLATEEIFRAPSPTEDINAEEYDLGTMHAEPLDSRRQARFSNSNGSLQSGLAAYPLTLGLAIHSLTDGLALGASTAGEAEGSTLSLVVFFALLIHKSPAALALGSYLINTPLSRFEIRKHLLIFSAATPFGTMVSFFLLNFLGTEAGKWTGIAMLISGGSFLYVATLIQPVGAHSHDFVDDSSTEEIPKLHRLSLLIAGIFLPFLIGSIFGHGHESHTG